MLSSPVRDAGARHDTLALGVDEVVALDCFFTGCRIAGHRNTGGTVAAHVAEYHGLDIDGRTQVVGILAALR